MATRPNGTYEVDPVSRIEGHLGVKVTTTGGIITDASAHGNLWRGFENFLLGRNVNDAITFTQRICGVCPVPHGMTATYAADSVLGYSRGHITFAYDGAYGVPAKAVNIRNLVLGAEFLMSSITHFYHLAAPSYVQGPAIPPWTPYFNDNFYHPALLSGGAGSSGPVHGTAGVTPKMSAINGYSVDVWSTVIRSYVVALRIRRLTFEAGALFAGRMPMTSVYIGGGVTFDGQENLAPRVTMFENIMKEVGAFIIQEYVPIALALGALYPGYDNTSNVATGGYGAGLGRYLAWGGFPDSTDTSSGAALAMPGGFKDLGTPANDFLVSTKAEVYATFLDGGSNSVKANLTEDINNSRYQVWSGEATGTYTAGSAYPGDVARTMPDRENGYTYMKAPRWNGLSAEVGPLARCLVAGLVVAGSGMAAAGGASGLYLEYTKPGQVEGSPALGLDPRMVSPDIGVALVNAGLAGLAIGATGTVVSGVNVLSGMPATGGFGAGINATYYDTDTIIIGAVPNYIIGCKAGASTMDRLRARALESLVLITAMLGSIVKGAPGTGAPNTWAGGGWTAALTTQAADTSAGSTWRNVPVPLNGSHGWGGTEAPRGALMHHVTTDGSAKITKYQCIVPTTWNGSPAVGATTSTVVTNHGAIEAAVMGAPFSSDISSFTKAGGGTGTSQSGVEVLRIAQSFDPCIACAIH